MYYTVKELILATNDVRGALARVQALNFLDTFQDKVSMDSFIRGNGFIITKSNYFPGSVLAPRCYACTTTTGEMLVFITGVVDEVMGRSVWDWYTAQPPLASLLGGWNPLTPKVSSRAVWIDIIQGLSVQPKTFVSGYSWGGVVGDSLLGNISVFPFGALEYNLTTFGSPKPHVQPDYPVLGWSQQNAWFNSDDAVPLIPPTITGLQRFMAGLSSTQGNRLASFLRSPYGLSISLTGIVSANPVPADNPIPQATQVGNWLAQTQAGLTNPHTLSVYEARLTVAVSLLPASRSVINVPFQPQPTPSHGVGHVVQQASQFQQTVFNDGTRQNATPVAIPSGNVFFAARTGRIWYVYFGTVQIAMAPKKRRARALANLGNAFVRKLQNEAVVNADDLGAQFVAYLAAASDPNGGFVPVMNTTP